jgi:hypothetical protein
MGDIRSIRVADWVADTPPPDWTKDDKWLDHYSHTLWYDYVQDKLWWLVNPDESNHEYKEPSDGPVWVAVAQSMKDLSCVNDNIEDLLIWLDAWDYLYDDWLKAKAAMREIIDCNRL